MTVTAPKWLKLLAMACAGVFLTWQIVTRTLVAALVASSPDLAQRLSPSDPLVLTTLAAEAVDAITLSKTAALAGAKPVLPTVTQRQIRQWAEAAIVAAPLNPTALRILGQLDETQPALEHRTALMGAAARLSRQETPALLWLLMQSYTSGDVAAATRYANDLLSTRSIAEYVVPVLARIAETPAGRAEVKKLLATNPSWRAAFFSRLPTAVSDARLPLDLLDGLTATPHPATRADYAPYLRFLIERKLYQLAYYAWLQSLDADQLGRAAMLFNGGFEFAPTGVPFDWVVTSGAGATAEFTDGPDVIGKQALLVQFTQGRVEFGGVSQMVLLAPGNYKLVGKYRGELSGRRGLEWQVSCAGSDGEPIGRQQPFLGAVRAWQGFEVAFKVPAVNCRAQVVKLVHTARSSSEQFIRGTAWFDGLNISVAPDE